MIRFNSDRTEVTVGPGKFVFTAAVNFGVLGDTVITGIKCEPLAPPQDDAPTEDFDPIEDDDDGFLEDDDMDEDAEVVELPPPNA